MVYNGSENIKKVTGKECGHLDSKAAIEEYLREVGRYKERQREREIDRQTDRQIDRGKTVVF